MKKDGSIVPHTSKIWKKIKQNYKRNRQTYYSLSLSFLIHLILLLVSSLLIWLYVQPPEITIGIDLQMEETFAQNPEPDVGQTPRVEDIPSPTPTPLPIQPAESPTQNEPTELKLPDPDQWKRELSEGIQEKKPSPIPKKPTEEWISSDALAHEQKIREQIENRQKLSQNFVMKMSAKTLQEGRTKGQAGLVRYGGGNEATQTAVEAGLRWLSRHQSPNGSWDCDGFMVATRNCTCKDAGVSWGDPAVTAFALLCFLGKGCNDITGDYCENVSRGLNYLLEIQDRSDGCFGNKTGNYMYNHAIATLAMTEGYLLCYDLKYRNSAIRGSKFLVEGQNPSAGWRYRFRSGDTDTSVTGWCMLALKANQTAEIPVPIRNIQDAKFWIDNVTLSGEYPWVGYNAPGANNYCMTAVGMLCRIFFYDLNHPNDRNRILGASQILQANLPIWRQSENDYYYWYYATLAMYQLGGEPWQIWNQALQKALLENQDKQGCQEGSWGNGAYYGGRIFWTSLNILSLQVYYRYPRFLNLYQDQNSPETKDK